MYTRLMHLFDLLDSEVTNHGAELTPAQHMELQQRAQALRQDFIRLAGLTGGQEHVWKVEVVKEQAVALSGVSRD